MAWGDEGVSKLQYKSDSVSPWGVVGQPKNVQLTKAGIIKKLRMIQDSGTIAFAGATTRSRWGPYNAYTLLELLANSQQDILRTSGYGLYLINCLLNGLELKLGPPNTSGPSPVGVTDQDYIFDGTETAAAGVNTDWNWFLDIPVAQTIKSIGGDVGMVPMSTENAQLQFAFTVNAATNAAPNYTIQSAADDLSLPYFGANAVTLPSPTLDLVRIMYEAILNPQDFPDFSFVSQWLEETPQQFSGTQFIWKQNQDAGILLRLIFGAFTTTSPWGVPTANLTNQAALQLSYNTDTAKFKETGLEALARQRSQLGFDMPQGVFFYDLLGPDLTLSDVLNTYVVPAIQLQMTYTAITLNATQNPKVIAQRLLPLKVA